MWLVHNSADTEKQQFADEALKVLFALAALLGRSTA
jgi:hypothetical protein